MLFTKEELKSCPCGTCAFGWANAQECKLGDCQDFCSDYKIWKGQCLQKRKTEKVLEKISERR